MLARRLLVEPARPQLVRDHPRASWLAVGCVCFGAFMGQLDASIVTLTFPALERDFHAPLAAVQWVSLAYLLTLVAIVTVAGRIGDAAGRKLVYLHGFGVFTAASAACALAPGLGWLVGFRLAQAVGAAMLQANSVALVVTSVPRQQMRRALGIQAAAQALGLAAGPALGGLLVAAAGWRWVFLVNVPVGVAALVAGRYLLPRTRQRTGIGRFDVAGLALLCVAVTAFLLAVSGLSGLPLPWWTVTGLAVTAGAGGFGFVARERRAQCPLIDLAVLGPKAMRAGLLGAMCGYLVLFGPLTLLPQLPGSHGAGAGLVLTALPAGFAVAAVGGERRGSSRRERSPLECPRWGRSRWGRSGWERSRRGTAVRAVAGAVVSVVAMGALAIAPASPVWALGWLFVTGLGLGVFIPANNAGIMEAVPSRMSATGGGLVSMSRGLGTALGVACVTLCLHVADSTGARGAGPHLASAALAVFALTAVAAAVAARPAAGAPALAGEAAA